MNPPSEAVVSPDVFRETADRVEQVLGLEGRPRAIVIHEKHGRCHAHVVWSRIDTDEMKATNLSFYKRKLNLLSKELYLENGWELPEGYRNNGWKNPLNFSLADWQQGKRLDLDPREVKQVFQSAWKQSDDIASFRNALEQNGFFLAKGDPHRQKRPFDSFIWEEEKHNFGIDAGEQIATRGAATRPRLGVELTAKLDLKPDADGREWRSASGELGYRTHLADCTKCPFLYSSSSFTY